MKIDVEAYLNDKGYGYKLETNNTSKKIHAVLNSCPICGHEGKGASNRMHINVETGQFNTYCCNRSGNMFTLKRELGDIGVSSFGMRDKNKVYANIKNQKEAKEKETKKSSVLTIEYMNTLNKALGLKKRATDYLKLRGFTDETILKFKLGWSVRKYYKCPVCKKNTSKRGVKFSAPKKCKHCGELLKGVKPLKNKNELIAIPIVEDGDLVNIKYRAIPPDEKHFERFAGGKTTLFNIDSLDGKYKAAYITESELDTIAMVQYGFETSVGLISGAGAAGNIARQFAEKFVDFDFIYIVTDMDEKGEEAADAIADALGTYRCYRVTLPYKDAAKCQQEKVTQEQIEQCIADAQRFGEDVVRHISDYEDSLDLIFDPKKVNGISTGFPEIDNLIVGYLPGGVSVITGDTGTGKTTYVVRQAYNISQTKGVLLASLENTMHSTLGKLIQMTGGKLATAMISAERKANFKRLSNHRLYIYDKIGRIKFSELIDSIEYAVRRYGVSLVILDHLEFFIESSSANSVDAINDVLWLIHETARKLNIHISIIVHPAKLKTGRNGEPLLPDLNDLKGSSMIKQIADFAIRLWIPRDRERIGMQVSKANITALKVRVDGGMEGTVPMRFVRHDLNYRLWTEADQQEENRLKKSERKKLKGIGNNFDFEEELERENKKGVFDDEEDSECDFL